MIAREIQVTTYKQIWFINEYMKPVNIVFVVNNNYNNSESRLKARKCDYLQESYFIKWNRQPNTYNNDSWLKTSWIRNTNNWPFFLQ